MRKKSMHAPRPAYVDKCKVVLKGLHQLIYNSQYRHQQYGFTMSQIAEASGYARSSRFMETLYSMCDDGLLEMKEIDGRGGPIKKEVLFRFKATFKQKGF